MPPADKSAGCALAGALILFFFYWPYANLDTKNGQYIDRKVFGSPTQVAGAPQAVINNAPNFTLPSPQQPPQQPEPSQPSGGGGSSGGGGAPPPPPTCTPSAPNDIVSSAGTRSGASNGNGGSWTISGLPANGTSSVSDSGMVQCGTSNHHTLRWNSGNSPSTNFGCVPTMASFVSTTVHAYGTGDTIQVTLSWDSGCP